MHYGFSMDLTEGKCNSVIRLPCKATDTNSMYRYVIWYKMSDPKPTTLLKRKNDDKEPTYYNSYNSTSLSVEDKETLKFHSAQPSDSGKYQCYLAAEIGGQNGESNIALNISECLQNTVFPTTMAVSHPIMRTTDSYSNNSDVPFTLVMLGFFLISVTKILLSIATVGVSIKANFYQLKEVIVLVHYSVCFHNSFISLYPLYRHCGL
ncbi:hypothetical protein DNTS_021051 [Danionella cerebrum]|uniref:Ig-like domain-containing protein n=1 Tax=Danionella cerebrum TaxID=2873325 RepID=A0A553MWU4_9TELE|nr:hypothetical protein DNTS_021051 [Danionella translucida]